MPSLRLSAPIDAARIPTLLDEVNAAVDRVSPGVSAAWVPDRAETDGDEKPRGRGSLARPALLAGFVLGSLLAYRWLDAQIRSDAVVDTAPPEPVVSSAGPPAGRSAS